MKKREILPLAKTIIRNWSPESYFISMILLIETAEEWLVDQYLKLYLDGMPCCQYDQVKIQKRDSDTAQFDISAVWSVCPFLDITYISNEFVMSNHKDIFEYIRAAIARGYYLYFTTRNERYDINSSENDIQPVFVCGYDEDKKCVITVSHFNDKGKIFYKEIDNHKFNAIYNSWSDVTDSEKHSDLTIMLLKLKDYEYHSDIKSFAKYVVNYLLTAEEKYFAREEQTYKGFGFYDLIQEYIDEFLSINTSTRKDIKLFNILCDHTQLWCKKIELLQRQGHFQLSSGETEKYHMLHKRAEKASNLFLMYWVQEDIGILIDIKKLLQDMRREEYSLIDRLHDILSWNLLEWNEWFGDSEQK